MATFILFTPQLLSVRQTGDVVVHLPPTSKSNTFKSNTSTSNSNTSKSNNPKSNNSTTKPSYMVVALHGMGPNYPDLFQHEVRKKSSFQLNPRWPVPAQSEKNNYVFD